MNERIKELIEQAGFKTESWLNLDGTPKATIYKEAIGGNNLEKFAELIVKECAYTCYNPDNEIYVTRIPMLYEAHNRIKKHFGVE
jgi:hypothetical protein